MGTTAHTAAQRFNAVFRCSFLRERERGSVCGVVSIGVRCICLYPAESRWSSASCGMCIGFGKEINWKKSSNFNSFPLHNCTHITPQKGCTRICFFCFLHVCCISLLLHIILHLLSQDHFIPRVSCFVPRVIRRFRFPFLDTPCLSWLSSFLYANG